MKAIAISAILVASLAPAQLSAQQQQDETVNVRLVDEPENPWREPATILGALGVLGGLAGILFQRYWHRRDEQRAADRAQRERLQAHVLDSLKWFEGKSQKRSLGIAVVEGNWEKFPDLRSTWLAVLANQAVYLLAESGQEDAAHERANLNRIVALLSDVSIALSREQRVSLVDAIDENISGGGLRGLDRNTLDAWRKSFK